MLLQRIAKDSAVYAGADVLTKALAFFAFPMIAAALSPATFGVLELITTATGLIGLVLNCGLNNAVQRFYWDPEIAPGTRPAIVTSGLIAQVGFGILALGIGSISVFYVLPDLQRIDGSITATTLFAALVVMITTQWTQYILDVIRLHFTPWRFLLLAIPSRLLATAFGAVAIVQFQLGLTGLLVAQGLVLTLTLPFALWLIRIDFHPRSVDRAWMSELIRFGYPYIFSGIAYWLFSSVDRWMLASMSTIDEVGIFSVAFRVSTIVLFITAAFGEAWSPIAMKIRADHPNSYRSIYGNILLLLTYIVTAVGGTLAMFSGEVVSILFSKYTSSALPLTVLCFAIVLQATQQITALGISIEKQTRLFARLAWIAAIVNITVNAILIPRFGATGAAWGTLVSYIALTTGYTIYTQRLHPIVIPWGRLGILGAIGIALAFVSMNSISYNLSWETATWKTALLVCCLLIGWKAIPLKTLKSFE